MVTIRAGGIEFVIERGFVSKITLTTALFEQHAATIWQRQPICSVCFSNVTMEYHNSVGGWMPHWNCEYDIPTEIWKRFMTSEAYPYPSETAALIALSDAACGVARMWVMRICPSCKGTGLWGRLEAPLDYCDHCNGLGTIQD